MASFFYLARDRNSQRVSGTLDATNEDELVARLQAMDLTVIKVAPETKEALEILLAEKQRKGIFRQAKHRGIKSDDLVLFCRQLTTLLASGVSILRSLDTLSKQVPSQRLYNVIEALKKDMSGGLSFHETLVKHPKVFSKLWVNLMESGEASGNLAIVLDRLAGYLERNAEFKKKIISSLIYPAILLATAIIALLFLTIKIIPSFAEIFKGFNLNMPVLTTLLIAASAFIRKYFLWIIILGMGVFLLLRTYIKTKDGRRNYEMFLFEMPVFGEFFRALITERFSSEMSTLIESGVPILYSLEIVQQSVGSVIVADLIQQIKEDVRIGKPLSQPLEKSGFFEPMVVQMVTIGEEVGELSPMLKKINTFYTEYVGTFLARFTAMFEPMILIFMGFVIGIMVVGMFLPIFQLSRMGAGG